MNRSRILRTIFLPLDVFVSVFAAFLALFFLLIRSLFISKKRDHRRVLTIATAPIFVASGDDVGGFSTYYVYPESRRSSVVFLDGEKEDRFAGRSLPRLIGLTMVNVVPRDVRRLLPWTSNVLHEAVSVARIFKLATRLRIGTISGFSPSRILPRTVLAAALLRTNLIIKVFGNQALLAHIKAIRQVTPLHRIAGFIQEMAGLVFSQIAYRRADLVIGYNINNAASAISFGADPAKTRMLRIRPHETILTMNRKSQQRTDQIVLWSRLAPEKAVYEACAAAIRVLERNLTPTLIIIGDGPDRQRLEALVKASQVADRVTFKGWLAREEVFRVVDGSAVALIPLGGYSLLEAAMLKVPVVCFDIEWHNEVISHEVSGLLADYPDANHMAELIEVIIRDPQKASRLADAAKLRVDTIFEPKRRDEDERRIMSAFFAKAEKRA